MSDLSNSVIMPREDFIELTTVAFDNHHVPTASERAGGIVQTTLYCAILGSTVVAVTWGWAKALDWRDEKKAKRERQMLTYKRHIEPQHS